MSNPWAGSFGFGVPSPSPSPFSGGGGSGPPGQGGQRPTPHHTQQTSVATDPNNRQLFVRLPAEVTDASSLRSHFAQFGALESLTCNFERQHAMVTYRTRNDAEQAKKAGKSMGGHTLTMFWSQKWGKPEDTSASFVAEPTSPSRQHQPRQMGRREHMAPAPPLQFGLPAPTPQPDAPMLTRSIFADPMAPPAMAPSPSLFQQRETTNPFQSTPNPFQSTPPSSSMFSQETPPSSMFSMSPPSSFISPMANIARPTPSPPPAWPPAPSSMMFGSGDAKPPFVPPSSTPASAFPPVTSSAFMPRAQSFPPAAASSAMPTSMFPSESSLPSAFDATPAPTPAHHGFNEPIRSAFDQPAPPRSGANKPAPGQAPSTSSNAAGGGGMQRARSWAERLKDSTQSSSRQTHQPQTHTSATQEDTMTSAPAPAPRPASVFAVPLPPVKHASPSTVDQNEPPKRTKSRKGFDEPEQKRQDRAARFEGQRASLLRTEITPPPPATPNTPAPTFTPAPIPAATPTPTPTPAYNTSTSTPAPSEDKIKAHLVGSCMRMCPPKEIYEREMSGDISPYEKCVPASEPDKTAWMVKKYRRNTADVTLTETNPEEVRPPDMLLSTMDHLANRIMDMKDVPFATSYNFLWDRTRGIRQDFTPQHVINPLVVSIHERIARFHIMAYHILCEEAPSVYEDQQNIEQLNATLVTLKGMYHDLRSRREPVECPNEPELTSYLILTRERLDAETLGVVMSTPAHVRAAPEMKFAMEVMQAMHNGNFVRFFKLLRDASFLEACLMHRRFYTVRRRALEVMRKAHQKYGFPVEDMAEILGFDGVEHAAEFLDKHNIPIENGMAVFKDGMSRVLPSTPELFKSQIVEGKAPPLRRLAVDHPSRQGARASRPPGATLPTQPTALPSLQTSPVAPARGKRNADVETSSTLTADTQPFKVPTPSKSPTLPDTLPSRMTANAAPFVPRTTGTIAFPPTPLATPPSAPGPVTMPPNIPKPLVSPANITPAPTIVPPVTFPGASPFSSLLASNIPLVVPSLTPVVFPPATVGQPTLTAQPPSAMPTPQQTPSIPIPIPVSSTSSPRVAASSAPSPLAGSTGVPIISLRRSSDQTTTQRRPSDTPSLPPTVAAPIFSPVSMTPNTSMPPATPAASPSSPSKMVIASSPVTAPHSPKVTSLLQANPSIIVPSPIRIPIVPVLTTSPPKPLEDVDDEGPEFLARVRKLTMALWFARWQREASRRAQERATHLQNRVRTTAAKMSEPGFSRRRIRWAAVQKARGMRTPSDDNDDVFDVDLPDDAPLVPSTLPLPLHRYVFASLAEHAPSVPVLQWKLVVCVAPLSEDTWAPDTRSVEWWLRDRLSSSCIQQDERYSVKDVWALYEATRFKYQTAFPPPLEVEESDAGLPIAERPLQICVSTHSLDGPAMHGLHAIIMHLPQEVYGSLRTHLEPQDARHIKEHIAAHLARMHPGGISVPLVVIVSAVDDVAQAQTIHDTLTQILQTFLSGEWSHVIKGFHVLSLVRGYGCTPGWLAGLVQSVSWLASESNPGPSLQCDYFSRLLDQSVEAIITPHFFRKYQDFAKHPLPPHVSSSGHMSASVPEPRYFVELFNSVVRDVVDSVTSPSLHDVVHPIQEFAALNTPEHNDATYPPQGWQDKDALNKFRETALRTLLLPSFPVDFSRTAALFPFRTSDIPADNESTPIDFLELGEGIRRSCVAFARSVVGVEHASDVFPLFDRIEGLLQHFLLNRMREYPGSADTPLLLPWHHVFEWIVFFKLDQARSLGTSCRLAPHVPRLSEELAGWPEGKSANIVRVVMTSYVPPETVWEPEIRENEEEIMARALNITSRSVAPASRALVDVPSSPDRVSSPFVRGRTSLPRMSSPHTPMSEGKRRLSTNVATRDGPSYKRTAGNASPIDTAINAAMSTLILSLASERRESDEFSRMLMTALSSSPPPSASLSSSPVRSTFDSRSVNSVLSSPKSRVRWSPSRTHAHPSFYGSSPSGPLFTSATKQPDSTVEEGSTSTTSVDILASSPSSSSSSSSSRPNYVPDTSASPLDNLCSQLLVEREENARFGRLLESLVGNDDSPSQPRRSKAPRT
eukprot:TRINITY_DN7527_c0_g1_i8.p1 TRINITY_DN7527_c0_g1~~TRINITY_DN7527_c0_g1_i8.p1  ORF type:complete len:2087 (+),score=538.50 TRINITY_DN7527_c0_g1_i8:73-6333(+)